MAFQVGEISAPITADMSGFNRAIDRVKSAGRQMTAMFTAPLLAAGTFAVKTAADYETLRQSMDILNGSVEEGARNFERLKRFSARTPFQLKDLAKAQNTLQGFSLSADDAFESISMIGDIAAVTGGDIQAISVAFGQAAAEGKLLTRDIRQLINQGVPAVQLLADSMGVATSEVFNLAEQGEITFDVLQKAFRDATMEGGLFADGMQKQSQTIAGVFSTLKDNTSIALAELGNTIVDTLDLKGIVKNLTAQIQTITQRFKEMSDESKRRILAVAGALMAGGPLLIAIGVAAKAVSGFASIVTSKFTLIAGSIALGVVAIQNLSDNWTNIMSEMSKQTASWVAATKNSLTLMAKAATFFGRSMPGAMQGYFATMDEAIISLQGLSNDSETEWVSFGESAKNATSTVVQAMQDMINSLSGGSLSEFLSLLSGGFGMATQSVQQFKEVVSTGFNTSMEQAVQKTGQLANKMATGAQQGSITQVALQGVADRSFEAAQAGAFMGQQLGQALSQSVLHAQNLLGVLGNLAKQFASRILMRGLSLLLGGGLKDISGLFGKNSFFGGMFHSGGVVPGSGSKLVRARGGEGIFTPSQMASMGNLGGSQISTSSMQKAFEKALSNHIRGVSDRKIFEMAEKGRFG